MVHLRCTGVAKSFGNGKRLRKVLHGVDVSVAAGEILVLVGRSGVGKTTLIRVLGGLESVDSGRVECSCRPRDVGYFFQAPSLLHWRSVYENVVLPLELAGAPIREEKVRKLLRDLGIGGSIDSSPLSLSVGMQARAALARLLVARPRVLLLDEPTAALDFRTKELILEHVRDYLRDNKALAVLVTHDLDLALQIADRIAVLAGTPATVTMRVEKAPIEDYRRRISTGTLDLKGELVDALAGE